MLPVGRGAFVVDQQVQLLARGDRAVLVQARVVRPGKLPADPVVARAAALAARQPCVALPEADVGGNGVDLEQPGMVAEADGQIALRGARLRRSVNRIRANGETTRSAGSSMSMSAVSAPPAPQHRLVNALSDDRDVAAYKDSAGGRARQPRRRKQEARASGRAPASIASCKAAASSVALSNLAPNSRASRPGRASAPRSVRQDCRAPAPRRGPKPSRPERCPAPAGRARPLPPPAAPAGGTLAPLGWE